MQQRRLIDNRKPQLVPSAKQLRQRKRRALGMAIVAALTSIAVLRA